MAVWVDGEQVDTERQDHATWAEATPGVAEVFTEAGLARRLEADNDGVIRSLVDQLRSPLGVIPFVGAGMSAPFGIPQWDPFLREAAERLPAPKAIDLLDRGEFELAAECVEAASPELFTDRMRAVFGRELHSSKLLEGAIACLPLLTTGPIITTNFDHVVEAAFKAAGSPFEEVIEGPGSDPIVAAIHSNRHALLKIHGTVNDRRFRIFTKPEYDRGYEKLEPLAWLIFTNRPLLFLGCSLERDRTVDVLEGIHGTLDSLRHYAILAGKYAKADQEAREKQLAGWGVRPLWFVPGYFWRIAELLDELLERSGSRELRSGRHPVLAGVVSGQRFRHIKLAKSPGDDLVKQIAGFVRAGEVAFSLGSAAHLGSLPLGDPFYDQMAEHFKISLRGDRPAVAAIVARRHGTAVLSEWVRRELDKPIKPGLIHQLLVALPGLLRSLGQKAPMLIFTTNYDATLERALREAGEPFHLLYYTEPEGRFAHVAPGGVVRMIERPDAIRALRPTASVIVKLNGGLIDCAPIGESFVIDIGQFERLAAQLPNVLPACVRTELERRHLLFLGHGLNESDLRKLVEFATPTKWAVQRPSASPALDRDLGQFGVSVFERELAARVPPGSALREIFEVHTPRALQRSPANRALERDLGQFNLTLIERDLGEFAAQLHTELAALR